MRVEILTFEDCPNAAVARERVERAIVLEGADATIRIVDVETPELAQELRFLGSPSVRIDGADVEPGADERRGFGLMCRTYENEGIREGAPSIEAIRAAIRLRIP